MQLTFLGATHEVTGSCFYLEACGKRILIDCGLEQGADIYVNQEAPFGYFGCPKNMDMNKEAPSGYFGCPKNMDINKEAPSGYFRCPKNMDINKEAPSGYFRCPKNMDMNKEIPVPVSEIDMVWLTHAHIDHSGKLPLLYQHGFRGQIYATEGTRKLCEIMLRDSAHIQMLEAEWKNRKAKRAGKEELEPLYDMDDANGAIQCFVGFPYDEMIDIDAGIRIRFVDAGHSLGSASIEAWLREEDTLKKIVFSGDIGNVDQPLIRDPQYIKEADYVVMESTYGDRSHGDRADYVESLRSVIQETFDRGGNVVIPSFAVGRTQELLYFIRKIKEEQLIKGHDGFEVYVDSPLATQATHIFMERMYEDFDSEALELVQNGINPIGFPGLKTSVSSDESKQINFDARPKVIISASGMCEAGRIKHHLKHNLWRTESTILFVGYQANGTLGRAILEGAKRVRLFGEEVEIKASIRRLPGVSGHADNEGLIDWIKAFEKKPEKVFVVHGEDSVCELFTNRLIKDLDLKAMAPFSGTIYDLGKNKCIKETIGVKVKKPESAQMPKNPRSNAVFARLWAAGQRLLTVIRHNEGGANKDMGRFTDQINALCDKWDR